MPRHSFASKAQWRWAFATHKTWARRWAHQTAGGPKVRFHRLPSRRTVSGVGSGRRRRLGA